MKAYTDIEQSKKLAEILPIESADAYYTFIDQGYFLEVKQGLEPSKDDIPCWSLAALLNTLPVSVDEGQHCLALINSNPNDIEWLCCYEDYKGDLMIECYSDNQVDACVEMIYKLKEKDLL